MILDDRAAMRRAWAALAGGDEGERQAAAGLLAERLRADEGRTGWKIACEIERVERTADNGTSSDAPPVEKVAPVSNVAEKGPIRSWPASVDWTEREARAESEAVRWRVRAERAERAVAWAAELLVSEEADGPERAAEVLEAATQAAIGDATAAIVAGTNGPDWEGLCRAAWKKIDEEKRERGKAWAEAGRLRTALDAEEARTSHAMGELADVDDELEAAGISAVTLVTRADRIFALALERNNFAANLRAMGDALDRVGAPRGGDLSTPAERVEAFARRLPRARISGVILYGRAFLPPESAPLEVEAGRHVSLRVSDAGGDAIFLGVEGGASCVSYVAADQADRAAWIATVENGRTVRLDHAGKSFFPPDVTPAAPEKPAWPEPRPFFPPDAPPAAPDAPPAVSEKPAWPAPTPIPIAIGTIAGGTPIYLHVDRRTVTEDARKAARPDRREPWCWLCGLSLTGPTTYEVDGLPVHGACFSGAEEGREKRMQAWSLEEARRFFYGTEAARRLESRDCGRRP